MLVPLAAILRRSALLRLEPISCPLYIAHEPIQKAQCVLLSAWRAGMQRCLRDLVARIGSTAAAGCLGAAPLIGRARRELGPRAGDPCGAPAGLKITPYERLTGLPGSLRVCARH